MKNNKKFLLSLVLSLLCLPTFAYQGVDVNAGYASPMEFSIFGGLSSSDTKKEIDGVNTNFGGSGFAVGVTGLGLINNFFGVGFDFTYSSNGYGKDEILSGLPTDIRMEHYTPLLFLKTYLVPPSVSPFSVYIPLGAGLDFARVTKRVEGNSEESVSDTITGFALMAGLGAEVNFKQNTFLAMEGRYNFNYYMGSNDYDIARGGNFVFVIKAGIKFDAGYDFLD